MGLSEDAFIKKTRLLLSLKIAKSKICTHCSDQEKSNHSSFDRKHGSESLFTVSNEDGSCVV